MTGGTPEPAFVRSDDVLTRELADALLLLSPGSGGVVSLTGAGPDIWAMLGSPLTVGTLVGRLADKYGVSPDDIAADVHRTLEDLAAAHVIRRLAA